MTPKDKETIQRKLGQIEGVAFMEEDKIADILFDAVEVISDILGREKGGNE